MDESKRELLVKRFVVALNSENSDFSFKQDVCYEVSCALGIKNSAYSVMKDPCFKDLTIFTSCLSRLRTLRSHKVPTVLFLDLCKEIYQELHEIEDFIGNIPIRDVEDYLDLEPFPSILALFRLIKSGSSEQNFIHFCSDNLAPKGQG